MVAGGSMGPSITGVLWDARTTERLAHELATGPGAAPLTEASVAWGRLAVAYADAAVEFASIAVDIRQSWQSDTADTALGALDEFGAWLTEAAASAVSSASNTGAAASAFAVAALTMPNAQEVDALHEVRDAALNASASLGGTLVGAAAVAETAVTEEHARASRVMESYEVATAAVTVPVDHRAPPVIARSTALDVENAVSTARSVAKGGERAVGETSGVSPMIGVPFVARQKSAFTGRTVSAAEPVLVASSTPVVTEQSVSHAAPMAPVPAAGNSAAAGESERGQSRSSAAEPPPEDVGVQLPEGWINFAEMESIAATSPGADTAGGALQ